MPKATPERHISGRQLLEELQALPPAVLERPACVWIEPGDAGQECDDEPKRLRWDVVGVETTARYVMVVLEDED